MTREDKVNPLVFSKLLAYIVESRTGTDNPVVFKLSELGELYQKRLEQKGIHSGVNKTRLKEKLLAEIPELEAHKSGREVLLPFKKDIGPVLSFKLYRLLLGKAA